MQWFLSEAFDPGSLRFSGQRLFFWFTCIGTAVIHKKMKMGAIKAISPRVGEAFYDYANFFNFMKLVLTQTAKGEQITNDL